VVSVAARLARALEGSLVVAHVASPQRVVPVVAGPYGYAYGDERHAHAARSAGQELVGQLSRDHGLEGRVEPRVEIGDPSTVLADLAEEERADLVVVGTRGHGRFASALLGSVSAALVCAGVCPVVVVPRAAKLGQGPIVCAVDDSSEGRLAARAARRLAFRLGSGLLLAHAAATPAVPSVSAVTGAARRLALAESSDAHELLDRLVFEERLGVDVGRCVVLGGEAEAISALADEEDAILIAVGSRRRGGLHAALTGSMSRDLVSAASRPVVIVP
jgi:nucleotide-binding universal stress UspA family protein